jgi:hypothetical protein
MLSKDLPLRTLSIFNANHTFRSLARIGKQWCPWPQQRKFLT